MPHSTASFPTTVSGKQIEVVDLETIDLAALVAQEPTEVAKLSRAAQSPGFFYLDLQNDSPGKQVLADLPHVYAVSEEYFDQPQGVKMNDYREGQNPSQDRGYKKSDCDETFEMSYDEMMQGTLPLPAPLADKAELLNRFHKFCYAASHTMLSCLSDAFKLDNANRFENSHRAGEVSDTGLKLISEPALSALTDVGDNKHTDSGTFTLLFYDQWGLHARLPDAEKWAFVAPKPGCAVVNVADSLQRLSRNRFHSPTHRVTQPVDGFAKRYFVSYFLRPEQVVKEAWTRT